MTSRLKERWEQVIWVTGGGKGIGRAVALELAARGCRVAISARTHSDLVDVRRAAESLPGIVYSFPVDISDAAATAATVARVETEVGSIDVAILNAGTHLPVSANSFTIEPFRALMDVNYFGTVHAVAALLPRMIERGTGQIAVVASVAGYRGLPSAAAYGPTKAALINFCEALKPELDPLGVRMTVVNPGFVRTPLTAKNPFPMPFLMEPEIAARRMVDGLDSGRFEITFPRRFTWALKVLRCLPYPLFFAVTRRLVRDEGSV